MLEKAKAAALIARTLSPLRRTTNLDETAVKEARQYIADYWPKLVRFHPKDDDTLIGLPKPYLVPVHEHGHEFDFNEMYYWDNYFMIQGLLDTEHKELVLGILEDLVSMMKRFKIIPNASRTYLMGRSQPPVLTGIIFDLYDAFDMGKDWLAKNMAVAKEEYQSVWMGVNKPHARQVYRGLSRYYDINYIHDLAETESGWDMTPRFGRKALNYLPVDLNALLYKYEMDFARAARIAGDARESAKWENAAQHRARTMDELMWDKLRGFYYDYNFVKEKKGSVSSLAGFYPMWVGMVGEKRAKQLVKALKRFEGRGGLATTDAQPLNQFMPGAVPTQWAYPNGWAPLHFIVVQGLLRYGFKDDARRIALKWLKTNLDWFTKHHTFLEKYNVIQPGKPPVKGLYPSQTGFGWTNAIFERFCQDFIDK